LSDVIYAAPIKKRRFLDRGDKRRSGYAGYCGSNKATNSNIHTIVRNVNSGRDSGGCKRDNFEGGEVGLEELFFLELTRPRQQRNETLRSCNKLGELGSHLFVDNSDEALPLSTDTQRITVGLNKSNVGLHNRSLVLNPPTLRVLVVVFARK
jgi:hypothetical protein